MSKGTVMVVEDDRLLAKAIGLFLTKRGYSVSVFHNSLDAQEYLHREQPDSAVLDIQLPDADGWSIAKMFRNEGKSQRTPVIMISVLTPDRRKLAEYRIHTYLQKPFDMGLLIEAVDQAQETKIANSQSN